MITTELWYAGFDGSTLDKVRFGAAMAKLIKKGMIYSPNKGEMVFTVPLFDEFMRRAIPEFEAG